MGSIFCCCEVDAWGRCVGHLWESVFATDRWNNYAKSVSRSNRYLHDIAHYALYSENWLPHSIRNHSHVPANNLDSPWNMYVVRAMGDLNCIKRRLMSVTASHITGKSKLFPQWLVHVTHGFPHQGPIRRKTFLCHDVIMANLEVQYKFQFDRW